MGLLTRLHSDYSVLSHGSNVNDTNRSSYLNIIFYAALLPRRGPHIASHSVCLSVCLSVRPSRYRASRRAT